MGLWVLQSKIENRPNIIQLALFCSFSEVYYKLRTVYHCCLSHDLDTTFRATAGWSLGNSGSKFCDRSVRVWSHSDLTCGEVLDLLLSKWPRGLSVVQLIVFWWFADHGPPHTGDLTTVLLFVRSWLHACFHFLQAVFQNS